MPDDRVLTVEEFAERVRAHPETVRRWLRQGKIRGTLPGGTKLGYRIPASEVDRFLGLDEPKGKRKAAA